MGDAMETTMFHCPTCHNEEDFVIDATGTRLLAIRCHKGDYEIRDEEDVDVTWTRVTCAVCSHEMSDAQAREAFDQAPHTTCVFCRTRIPIQIHGSSVLGTAQIFKGRSVVCNACWDDRSHSTA
jgi:hypothetical protein